LAVCYLAGGGPSTFCYPYDNYNGYGPPFVKWDNTACPGPFTGTLKAWIICSDPITGGGEIYLTCYTDGSGHGIWRITFVGSAGNIISYWDKAAASNCCPALGDYSWAGGDNTTRLKVTLFAAGGSTFPSCC
jgi:hypothetical protein